MFSLLIQQLREEIYTARAWVCLGSVILVFAASSYVSVRDVESVQAGDGLTQGEGSQKDSGRRDSERSDSCRLQPPERAPAAVLHRRGCHALAG